MNMMEKMNSEENNGLLESLKQKLKKLQNIAILAGTMFVAQETFAQNTTEQMSTILGNAKKVELSAGGVENINKLHHSIDSLLNILGEHVLKDSSAKEVDFSVYGFKPDMGNHRVYDYKDISIGTGDVKTFSFKSGPDHFNYGSNGEDNCSLMKDNESDSETAIYNESKGLYSIDPIKENTASEFEKNLQEVKDKVQAVIDEVR